MNMDAYRARDRQRAERLRRIADGAYESATRAAPAFLLDTVKLPGDHELYEPVLLALSEAGAKAMNVGVRDGREAAKVREEGARHATGLIEEYVRKLITVHHQPPAADPLAGMGWLRPKPPAREPFDTERAAGEKPAEPLPSEFRTDLGSPPGVLARLFGARERYEARAREAAERDRTAYEEALTRYRSDLENWEAKVHEARQRHEQEELAAREKYRQRLASVEEYTREILQGYEEGDPGSIKAYFQSALDACGYFVSLMGEDYNIEVGYLARIRCLVTQYHVRAPDEIIPAIQAYKATKQTFAPYVALPRLRDDVQWLYATLIASISLKAARDVFAQDQARHAHDLVVNCRRLVKADSLIPDWAVVYSVRIDRSVYERVDPDNVDPLDWATQCGARISSRIADVAAPAVRPFVDYDDLLWEAALQ